MNDNDRNSRAVLITLLVAFVIVAVAVALSMFGPREKSDIGGLGTTAEKQEHTPQPAEHTEAGSREESSRDESNSQDETGASENNEASEENEVKLTENLKAEAKQLAEEFSKEYEAGYKEGRYISSYGYLYDLEAKVNAEAEDIGQTPSDGADIAVHLFKPKDVREYLKSEPDEDELCVYTAVRTDEGILLASKHGEGLITPDQYRTLILSYSPDNNGEPVNLKKGSEEYKAITAVITEELGFSDYEIKHLVCNNKYAVFVIGYAKNPSFLRECVMEKKNGKWEITFYGVEAKKSAVAEVNEMYPDFDMALYPVYSIYDYLVTYGITSSAPNVENLFVQAGLLKENDLPPVYESGTGNFIYIEGAAGTKLLGYKKPDKTMEGFNVNDTFEAIAIMREKEDNPPVFIIKMDDDMVK